MAADVPGTPNEEQLDDAALEALGQAYAAAPPETLRERVLLGVSNQRLRTSLNRWRQTGLAAGAAAATLAIFVAYGSLTGGQAQLASLDAERQELLAQLESQRQDLLLLEDALEVHGEVMRILTSADFRSATLTAPDGGAGTARVLLDPASGAVAVLGKGIAPPQTGRVYELWAIRGDGTPEAAGTLRQEGRSFAIRMHEVADPAAVARFAISLEPEGGAERPTGPIVLAGSVTR